MNDQKTVSYDIGTWEMSQKEGRIGTGNWDAWGNDVGSIFEAAKQWSASLKGIERPWLCWNIDDDWCRLQQKLVLAVGWTPVVGHDTFIENQNLVDGSICVNFNSYLNLPRMWMHFPIEFMFLFCDKLAFWHSDFVCSLSDMKKFANIFENLLDGECAAAFSRESRWPWRDRSKDRYFELLGCTTRLASKSQYDCGVGWWRNINKHPNFNREHHTKDYNYEHGVGILVWEQVYNGKVIRLLPDEKKGHCNTYTKKLKTKKSKQEEMKYYQIRTIARELGIEDLL